jgi:hypothetical protein
MRRKVISHLWFLVPMLVCSCMDHNIYDTSRPAVIHQYHEYLNDINVQSQADRDWEKNNQSLVEDGFAPVKHPYGDKSLMEMGIDKIRSHKFSDQ